MFAIAITCKAQFKIHSNGKMSFNTTATPNCPISLNGAGNADFFMSYNGYQRFLYAWSGNSLLGNSFVNEPNRQCDIAITASFYSIANNSTNSNQIAIGAYGRSKDAPYNYGVLGNIDGTLGAGVVGSSYNWVPSYTLIDKKYAGLFMGDVKVTSNLKVEGSIQGTLLGVSAPLSGMRTATPLSQERQNETAEQLSLLDAFVFHHNETRLLKAEEPIVTDTQLGDSTAVVLTGVDPGNYIGIQGQEKNHFGLDARQLEEIFPDLVYEMEDGTKAINYVEMVPLLVQCIKELNARLSSVEGGTVRKARSTSGIDHEQATNVNRLYQNNPNPFKEQTLIRFTLANDAADAAVCIFDMTGKQLRRFPVTPGMDSITINGGELGAGMFLYSLIVDGQEIDTKRMILSK